METTRERYARYRRVLEGVTLPAALVDLDALERNAKRLFAPLEGTQKTLRVATKSIRAPGIIDRVLALGGTRSGGLMTYSAEETLFLVETAGARDLLLAYPTFRSGDCAAIAEANRRGACAQVVVDSEEHLGPLARAATRAGVQIPIVIEVDMAWRPLNLGHLGVRRSPLRGVDEIVALAERVRSSDGLRFWGIMGYEAQIAGLTDKNPFSPLMNGPKRMVKRGSRPYVERTRRALRDALTGRGLAPKVMNGGGTGSIGWSAAEEALTEVTAGSGFMGSHLFDYYRDLSLEPAACFALQVVRRPGPGLVCCHGGGWIASGEAGPDRLPVPWLPEGLALLPREGAGEVQTPIVTNGTELALGDPIFFRHAKAGELAEHVSEYLLVRGDRLEARVPTYRGLGRAFLG
jgi:D-serine deaminase-like pyridoxal phosphate-dependent protein